MFSLTSDYRYYYYGKATDMRKGFDGLCGIIQTEFSRQPSSGEVFLFINRGANRMKLLRWESGGFVLYYKRLEQGTFHKPILSAGAQSCQIKWSDLMMIVQGIQAHRISYRKRYEKTG